MDITGMKIKHKTFGTGTVTSINGEHIVVSFGIGEKTFIYPDAFLNFLSVDNVEVHTYIHNLLEQKVFEKELLIEQNRSNFEK